MEINIEKNKQRYISLLRWTERENIDKLIEYLEKTDFFLAPCSTRFHLSVEGGLCLHSLNVFEAIRSIMEEWGLWYVSDELQRDSKETYQQAALVALLHDICKADCYKIEQRWRKDANQQWEQYPIYTFDEQFAYGHSEKSVYIAQKFIKLSDYEAQAINGHMGFSDIRGANLAGKIFGQNVLALFLHMADLSATYIWERE